MMDFLTFQSFISIEFFIIFYYIGALVIPAMMILNGRYFYKRFLWIEKMFDFMNLLFSKLTTKQKILSILISISLFIFLEILWRVCFEMIIGYFQLIESVKA